MKVDDEPSVSHILVTVYSPIGNNRMWEGRRRMDGSVFRDVRQPLL